MTNEQIAIELVKAWCIQPSTASQCFKFDEVMENYKKALEELNKCEQISLKDEHTDYSAADLNNLFTTGVKEGRI